MKLTVRILALLLALSFLFSGCTSINNNAENKETQNSGETISSNKTAWLAGLRGGTAIGWEPVPFRSLQEYSESENLHYPSDELDYYNVLDNSKKIIIDELNNDEFNGIANLIDTVDRYCHFSSGKYRIVITIDDFNRIKPISAIKTFEDREYKYAYNLYRYNGKTICIIYDNEGGVLHYREVFFYDKIQPYDELKNNTSMTYKEAKNTKKELYEESEVLARISDDSLSYVSYVDRYTTHITEKGFLIIGYKNKKPHQVKHSYLAKGIYKKLHQSLLLDMLLDSQA